MPLSPITELPPGLVLRGKYEILEKIGAGGMGAVYKARHLAFGEFRAIKLVAGPFATEEALSRFRAEAVLARKLDHPNAVRVDDLDTAEDGRPFMVMEYVLGRSLREVLAREGCLPVPRALGIAAQACDALAAAHELGIIHRDIKPDNLLLAAEPEGMDRIKILDFGLAKVREGFDLGAGRHRTRTGRVVGTPQYISPEQAMGLRGDGVDGRADLYSLGVVLYEMVTGLLPFRADSPMRMMLQHVQEPPQPPDEIRPDLGIPDALSSLVLRALQKEPAARFSSAALMREALLEVAALPQSSFAPRGERRAASPPAPTPRGDESPTVRMPASPVVANAPAARKRRILLVDDDREVLAVLKQRLEARGFEIGVTAHPQMALRLAKESQPDLVICDVDMEERPGGDVAKDLSNDPATRSIPFLFLSSLVDAAQAEGGAGARPMLPKSISSAELVQWIETTLGGSSTR